MHFKFLIALHIFLFAMAIPVSGQAAPLLETRIPSNMEMPTVSIAHCGVIFPKEFRLADPSIAPHGVVLGKVLQSSGSPFAMKVYSFSPESMAWWLTVFGSMKLDDVACSVHEASHLVNVIVQQCNSGRPAYFFNERTWPTELETQGESVVPMSSSWIPDSVRRTRKPRYETYVASGRQIGLHMLLEEFNAYAGAAEFELAAVGGQLFDEYAATGYRVDNNLGGSADFMFYLTAYLRGLRLNFPQHWQKIKDSPQLLAYMQQLWTKSESQLAEWDRRAIEVYMVPRELMALTYTATYIGELDRLGIRHLPNSPVKAP